MATTGIQLDDQSVTVSDSDSVERRRLSALVADGPIILAFIPAAYTGTCTEELCTVRDRFPTGISDHTLFAVSVDSPFVHQQYREDHDLPFPFISDFNRTLIDALDLSIDFEDIGLYRLAQRAIVALDTARTVTYFWVADHPGELPPFDQIESDLVNT